MASIVFHPSDDRSTQDEIRAWIKSAGGSLSLEEIEQKHRVRFNYDAKFTTNEARMKACGFIESALRFNNGIVSLPAVQ